MAVLLPVNWAASMAGFTQDLSVPALVLSYSTECMEPGLSLWEMNACYILLPQACLPAQASMLSHCACLWCLLVHALTMSA